MTQIQVKGLVVHSMSEYIFYQNKWIHAKSFLNKVDLSVHGFIAPNGDWIVGNVNPPSRASHAGVSQHLDLTSLNNHYLGFELLLAGKNDYAQFLNGIDLANAFSEAQVNQAVAQTVNYANEYGFTVENVVSHQQVSGDHVRGVGKGKKDPGKGFPWEQFIESVRAQLS